MKLFFVILFGLIFFSCNETSISPTETEIINVVTDLFNPKELFSQGMLSVSFPSTEFEQIKVINISKKKGLIRLFDAVVIVKGKMYNFIYEPDFIDTLHLVLKNENLKWIVKEKDHHFKPRKKIDYPGLL